MTPPLEAPHCLQVSRADLATALKNVSRAIRKQTGDAEFRFGGDALAIRVANTTAEAPAHGTWPKPIFVNASFVSKLAKLIPEGDPVRLHVESGKLYANRFSQTCTESPTELELPKNDENALISEAAKCLKSLFIKRTDLEQLVSEAQEKTSAWSLEDHRLMTVVTKAWSLLAPLGVEPADIRRLISEAKERGTGWSAEEKKLLGVVMDAWVLLAPLGVEPADIRRLISSAVRNAWK